VLLLLKQSFYGRENAALTKELCNELPGIFNWSLDGLQKLRERGRFDQPVVSADAIREMEDLASPIGAFIRDRCVLGHDKSIEVDALYRLYRVWCDENGLRAGSATTFGRDIRASRPEIKRLRPGTGANRPYCYAGISILKSMDVWDVNGGDGNHVHNVHGLKDRRADVSDEDGDGGIPPLGVRS
jgi:putative DNA primase/helicase